MARFFASLFCLCALLFFGGCSTVGGATKELSRSISGAFESKERVANVQETSTPEMVVINAANWAVGIGIVMVLIGAALTFFVGKGLGFQLMFFGACTAVGAWLVGTYFVAVATLSIGGAIGFYWNKLKCKN